MGWMYQIGIITLNGVRFNLGLLVAIVVLLSVAMLVCVRISKKLYVHDEEDMDEYIAEMAAADEEVLPNDDV